MKGTNIKKAAAISRAGTFGTGALTGTITGGLGSLSRTDEPARLIGGFAGGALGGTAGSILPAAILNSQMAVKMLNSPKAKGFATLFKILNVLMAAGGGAMGSKMGENVASVVKNNITKQGNAMFKSAGIGSNGVARLFGNIMKKPMGDTAFNYLKALPKDYAKGTGWVNSVLRQAKRPGSGVGRAQIGKYLDEAKGRMAAVTEGPRFNSPWSPIKRIFGNDLNLNTPQELLDFVKKMNG